MDERLRDLTTAVRRMPSGEAADWLLQHYPVDGERWGDAIAILEHLSLGRADNMRLAAHYLSRAPYASDRPYRLFARLLGLPALLRVLSTFAPFDESRADLLGYHLKPVFLAANSKRDRLAIDAFLRRIRPK